MPTTPFQPFTRRDGEWLHVACEDIGAAFRLLERYNQERAAEYYGRTSNGLYWVRISDPSGTIEDGEAEALSVAT